MIPELGQLCLILAFLVSLLQAGVPLLSRLNAPYRLLHLTKPMATITFLLIATAFAALITCHVTDDFSVLTVVLNSHTSKPLLYKITGAWGNHEGSMLLWMFVLSACGFLVAYLRARDAELKAVTLAVLGLISAGFLAFILFTSNPFLRVFPVPANGEDLNPILQDIGLSFHPPTLYIGYVGFGIVFCYAIAGLWLKRIDGDWARTVRPWILLPWSFLTLGIGAGSWWAYRTLGWGGWWFWDPVENVSLLPWLTGTALLHSNMVLERRGQLARWVALLAILTFTMSLIGTFIVRSGLITSVHAFAADPLRGLYILAYIVIVSGGGLLVFGLSDFTNVQNRNATDPHTPTPPLRGELAAHSDVSDKKFKQAKPVNLLSRSGLILINNLLLVAAACIVLIAILYPLALELLHQPSISVGPHYFNSTFLPMTALLPLLAAIAPLVAWDSIPRAQLRSAVRALAPAMLVAIIIAVALISPPSAIATLSLALGGTLLLGTYHYLARMRAAQVKLFSDIGLRHLASASAHAGLSLFVLGMGITATFKHTYELPLDARAPMQMGAYSLRLIAADRREENNYIARRATLRIEHDGHFVTDLTPELRYYPVRNMQTAQAALYSTPLRDIYVVLGESNYSADGKQASLGLRMYVTPGQQLLWSGFLLAGLGGFIGLCSALRRREDL